MSEHQIVYGAMSETTSGLSYFMLFVYRPRSGATQRLIDYVKFDASFPRNLQTKAGLDHYLRHHHASNAIRCAADAVWASFQRWRRQQTELAAA